ncbi:TrmH family RNA methyltransferase [Georgenia alba]|uniref:TrmH family RNA methyltransferase n=1 Tax=Georgenia alba TaxID=2233858 RepID=A0ABW2Q7H6_9MICO
MLTNPRAERVRRVARLSGRSAREKHGQYLVEGPQAVREALRHVPQQVRDVYHTADAAARHPELLADARGAVRYVHETSEAVMGAMSTDAQGLLAVLDRPTAEPGLADLPALRDGQGPRLVAVLAQVTDPGNAGTVIRAADAAGADAVVLCAGSVEVRSPKVVRATAGSLFHLPVITGVGLAETVAALRGTGASVLAADGAGGWDLDDLLDRTVLALDLAGPTSWVFGHEARGLSEEETAMCDAVVRVPIHGRAESLNLAVAAAVCLYASARAQRR